jgi:hypothetical protein
MKNSFKTKRIVPSILLLCMGFAGCKALKELTTFYITYAENVTIAKSTMVDLPIDIATPDIVTNSEATFSANNTRKDLIDEIKLRQAKLIVTIPAGGDFSFLKSVALYISSANQAETKIAWRDDIPDDVGNELVLLVSDADLKEYIKADKYKLRIKALTDKLTSQDYTVRIETEFAVKGRLR